MITETYEDMPHEFSHLWSKPHATQLVKRVGQLDMVPVLLQAIEPCFQPINNWDPSQKLCNLHVVICPHGIELFWLTITVIIFTCAGVSTYSSVLYHMLLFNWVFGKGNKIYEKYKHANVPKFRRLSSSILDFDFEISHIIS